MREISQRFWDAMIIKAWQDFRSCGHLYHWSMEEFGKPPEELGLKRIKNMWGKREFVYGLPPICPSLVPSYLHFPKNAILKY